jgi:secreted trypsin-like serine protease
MFRASVQGDSGGPLTVEVEGGHTLVGVVSHRGPEGCGQVRGRQGRPSVLFLQGDEYDVYTEVGQFMAWLEKTILKNGGLASCGLTLQADPEAPDIAGRCILKGGKAKM